MSNAARLRSGWPAASFDAIAAVGATLLAYSLRFELGEARRFLAAGAAGLALVLVTQLMVVGATWLYRVVGQLMWPIRLISRRIAGTVVGPAAAFALDAGQGLSRQALIGQAALFIVGGGLWRSLVGLRV